MGPETEIIVLPSLPGMIKQMKKETGTI